MLESNQHRALIGEVFTEGNGGISKLACDWTVWNLTDFATFYPSVTPLELQRRQEVHADTHALRFPQASELTHPSQQRPDSVKRKMTHVD